METLKLSKEKALKLYPSAQPEFKMVLEETFGVKFFSQKITDRVKTFDDACNIIREDPDDTEFCTGSADEIAYKKLKVIAKALNEGWTPDWNSSNQYKWSPWFYLNQPGFRFNVAFNVYTRTFSTGGSRLCFKSEELAIYAGQQFIDLYKQFLN